MEIDLARYSGEIADFLSCDTLMEIDCGILDLSHVGDIELKNVFCYLEELLAVELELNYRCNGTGIFRVHLLGKYWCYCEEDCVIVEYSANELKKSVISKNRIWYVFDEYLAEKIMI